MLSYWEKKWFTHYDNIVVGAGLAGLFTAMHLKRKFPSERVLVIDKNSFPAASTKNAGFACMGSITELEDDLKTASIEHVVSLFEKRYHGLKMMREELGDENIDYTTNGSFELIKKTDLSVLERIDFWNEKLFHIANKNAFPKLIFPPLPSMVLLL